MPRGKKTVKKIMAGNAADAAEINEMFAQMTGEGEADLDVVIPKLRKLIGCIKKYAKIYNMLLNFNEFLDSFPEYEDNFREIKTFVLCLDINISDACKMFRGNSEDNEIIAEPIEVSKSYKKLKSCKCVQSMIVTSAGLKKHKKYLYNKNNLQDDFIKREPGLTYFPIKFAKLDIKTMWSSAKLTPMAKKYMLSILSHTFTIGHEVYSLVTSPDIDIRKFSGVLLRNIESMKNQIPRCGRAFDVIANSIGMLESKFDNYYKTSVEAENPSIIMESFIVDVSLSQKTSASTTAQFRKIIMFMKRQASNNKDPRVAKLFKILNSQFKNVQAEDGQPIED